MTEVWISTDPHVVLERSVDDPRTGKSSTTVTSLERIEPDPALFQVPPDYTVKEQPQN